MARLCAIFIIAAVPTANAGSFLGASRNERNVVREAVEQALLWELSGADSSQIASIRKDLLPMYASLPKTASGRLESPTARYALQRYFQKSHGWNIQGFDLKHEDTAASSSGAMKKEMVPAFLQKLLLERHHGNGWDLDDLASWAATILSLIHGESVTDVEQVYDALSLSIQGNVEVEDFDQVMRGYLSVTFIGQNVTINEKDTVEVLEEEAKAIFAGFNDIITSLRDLRMTLDHFDMRRNPFVKVTTVSFERAVDVMRSVPDMFSKITQMECQAFKSALVKMDSASNGRVPLKDFYANQALPMHESLEYLRNLGVMEEKGFKQPRLVIANYMSSVSRCVSFSNYYEVCCPDECDHIRARIESEIAAPETTPKRIADIVSKLPSDTVDARNISSQLLSRLNEIADLHQGYVPLHGRLFKQWLHHAYPRECPYPHLTGTYQPATQDEWLLKFDELDDAMASPEEKAAVVKAYEKLGEIEVDAVPWTATEELVASDNFSVVRSSSGLLRPIMGMLLLGAIASPLWRTTKKLLPVSDQFDKQIVV